MSTKKLLTIIGSILFTFVLIEALLIASLCESIYLEDVYDKIYPYIDVDYEFGENTTLQWVVVVEIENNITIIVPRPEINQTIELLEVRLDYTVFLINTSLNRVIIQGTLLIANISFLHTLQGERVYLAYDYWQTNTTVSADRTYTTFIVHFKTSDIAESLGVVTPFWVN